MCSARHAGRHDEAIASYRQALSLRPEFPEAFANYVHSLQCVCEWHDRPQLFARCGGGAADGFSRSGSSCPCNSGCWGRTHMQAGSGK